LPSAGDVFEKKILLLKRFSDVFNEFILVFKQDLVSSRGIVLINLSSAGVIFPDLTDKSIENFFELALFFSWLSFSIKYLLNKIS